MKLVAAVLSAMLLLTCLAVGQEQPTPAQHQPTAQGARPPASPPGQAEFSLADGKKLIVKYNRPLMRGRKIMGELVPYGKVWRTGANAATTLETQADLKVGGTQLPAGKYSVYTIPGEQEWTIIINKQTGQWGTEYNQAQDAARVSVKPVRLDAPVDQFTISFQPSGSNAAVMKLEWENTSVPVELSEAK